MRLVRSNDDPKLIADLERLAGAEAVARVTPPEVLEADLERLAASTAGSASHVPIDDTFVRRFVQGSLHLRRYAPFYAGAGLWIGAMILIQPVGGGGGGAATATAAAGSGRAVVASVTAPAKAPSAAPVDGDIAGSPVFDSFGGSVFDSADSDEFADFDRSEPATEASSELAFEDDTETFESDEFESTDEEAFPDPLAIVESGYASSTAGTPLEQAPSGGGLPITAAGGTTAKYSFVRLDGGETTISLQEAADDNINSATASVQMCPLVTASWVGGGGQAMTAAPKYDTSACAVGTRSSTGLWSFDLSGFAPVGESNGFALVPGPGTGATFQVVLDPVAVVPVSAEG